MSRRPGRVRHPRRGAGFWSVLSAAARRLRNRNQPWFQYGHFRSRRV